MKPIERLVRPPHSHTDRDWLPGAERMTARLRNQEIAPDDRPESSDPDG
jgi:hypothetical protein